MAKRRNFRVSILGFLFLGLVLVPDPVLSETASTDEMTRACSNWLSYMTFQTGKWAGSSDPQVTVSQDITVNDTVIGRYFEIEPEGYVFVPVLKEMPPIEAYSDVNRLDWSEPDGFTVMLKEVLMHRIRLFVNLYGSLEAGQPTKGDVLLGHAHRLEWDRYLQSEEQFKQELTAKGPGALAEVGPLLTTVWHQNSPYNQLCPMGDGGRTVVGCVATAAAQIMAYYKWPPEGTGNYTDIWGGDFSCDGSSPGASLYADFSDPYDWDNMPDACGGSCTPAQINALAELCYEVGVAFNMDYGRCGSGAYTADAQYVFPAFFRYHDWIEKHDRVDNTPMQWSDRIRAEVEAGRPFQYRIYSHSIVGDGWRQAGSLNQIHLNYGWGGSNNSWYTIDELYCPWEGCNPMVEYMISNIVPDNGVVFTADTTWGQLPLQVSFTGISPLSVDTWTWDFGDGDSSSIQSPLHMYSEPGRYDVTLQVNAGGEVRRYATTDYISVLADSLIGARVKGNPNTTVEVTISAANTVPLRYIKVPVEYSGTLDLTLASYSTTGCRIDYFDQKRQLGSDPTGKNVIFSFYNVNSSTPDLPAGSGPILKLYFTISASATIDQTTPIVLDGVDPDMPTFFGPVIEFSPILKAGSVGLNFICGDADANESVSIMDVIYVINYIYREGPAPIPLGAGDANADGNINIMDVSRVINYLYRGGPAPACP